MRASTTDDNEAYSDSDARIDPFIYVAILRICIGYYLQLLRDVKGEKTMLKKLNRYAGSLQQEIYARPICYREGRAKGMDAVEVKCGDLFFHVMADKCLDISDLSYKGQNMTFLSKPGLIGRNHYDTNGGEAQRSIMGGLFFTCGYENICAPCRIDGKDYPMHGRMRTTPAEHVLADVVECGDTYKAVIRGEMREGELFGENLVLRRTIECVLGENSILIRDEVENQSFRDEPLMLLYHCNAGYPFLDEHTQLYLPVSHTRGREEFSQQHLDRWNLMDPPKDNEPEYVFIHEMKKIEDQLTPALMVNHETDTALLLEYDAANLPYFMEWKSTASGDYVIGLEPSNSMVYGRTYHEEHRDLHHIGPFEKETFTLKFTAMSGTAQINETIDRIQKM